MLTTSSIQVLPAANTDTSTYYLSLQPITAGKSPSEYTNVNLNYNPSTGLLTTSALTTSALISSSSSTGTLSADSLTVGSAFDGIGSSYNTTLTSSSNGKSSGSLQLIFSNNGGPITGSNSSLQFNNQDLTTTSITNIQFAFNDAGSSSRHAGVIQAGKDYNAPGALNPWLASSGYYPNYISFWTRGVGNEVERMRIDSNGNIGIANTIPVANLDVNGSFNANGTANIAGNVYIGGALTVVGNTIIENTFINNAFVNTTDTLVVSNTTPATSTGSGALQISGGAGIQGNVWIGGNTSIAGYATITGNTYHAGNVAISNTTVSTSTTTGALTVGGGVGIVGNTWIGGNTSIAGYATITGNTFHSGNVAIACTTTTTSTTTGALTVSGGVGISGNTWVGGNVTQQGPILSLGIGTSNTLTISTSYSGLNGSFNFQAPANGVFSFQKTASTPTNGYRYDMSVGGLANIQAGPFWNGFHLAAPDPIILNGITGFPRAAQYWSYDATTNPTYLQYNVILGNSGGVTGGANATMALGTNENANVLFLTNGTERMRIDSAGNVGIGTTSPSSYGKLAIGLAATGSAVNNIIGIYNSAAVDAASLRIAGYRYTSGTQTAIDFIQNSASNFKSQIAFSTDTGGGLTEKMRIDDAGNVGIGTSSPGSYGKFAVVASSGSTFASYSTVAGNYLTSTITDSGAINFYATVVNSTTFNIGSPSAIPLLFVTNNTERMRISAAGLVGIGNTSPVANLDVNGSFNANSSATLQGITKISNTTVSTSNTTGALVISGGTGITGNLFMSSANNFYTTTASASYRLGWTDNYFMRDFVFNGMNFNGNFLSITSGQFYTQAGIFATFRGPINNDTGNNVVVISGTSGVLIQNNFSSTSNTTGALVVSGGAGIKGNVYTGTLYSTSGGIGYPTGIAAGGSIVQNTSRTSGVTLNTLTGQITLFSTTGTTNVATSFTLTNSNIGANDMLLLNHFSGGTIGAYALAANTAAGSAQITVRPIFTTTVAEAPIIQFALIKSSVT